MTAQKGFFIDKSRRIKKRTSLSSRNRKKEFKKKIFCVFIIIVVFSVFAFYILVSRGFWGDGKKVSVAIRKKDGGVVITTLNPETEELVNIHIPSETQVEVARQLGVWPVKSLWELSKNEHVEGKLLAESIIKHFSFPVAGWADSDAEGFSTAEFLSLVKAVFLPYATNLTFSDKLSMAIFVGRMDKANIVDIDLEKTGYLELVTLADGEVGYIKSGKPSPYIMSIFADSGVSKVKTRIFVRNLSGDSGIVDRLGEVTEVLGAKITAVAKEEKENINCIVRGLDEKGADKIAQIFSCSREGNREVDNEFDLEMLIGEEFSRRY